MDSDLSNLMKLDGSVSSNNTAINSDDSDNDASFFDPPVENYAMSGSGSDCYGFRPESEVDVNFITGGPL